MVKIFHFASEQIFGKLLYIVCQVFTGHTAQNLAVMDSTGSKVGATKTFCSTGPQFCLFQKIPIALATLNEKVLLRRDYYSKLLNR